MAAPWLPRVLRLGHITLEEGLKPHFDAVKKMWIKPRISKRVAARIRKEAIITGNYKEGGIWDPAFDNIQKYAVLRPPKGTKRFRSQEQRLQKVRDGLSRQVEITEQYRQQKDSLKPKGENVKKWLRLIEG